MKNCPDRSVMARIRCVHYCDVIVLLKHGAKRSCHISGVIRFVLVAPDFVHKPLFLSVCCGVCAFGVLVV